MHKIDRSSTMILAGEKKEVTALCNSWKYVMKLFTSQKQRLHMQSTNKDQIRII